MLEVEELIGERSVRYQTKEEVESCIQRECETRFLLGHSAPISKHKLLTEQLGYLLDGEVVRQIITGVYKIPEDLDPATTLVLHEIGKMGRKLVTGDGEEIIVTQADYIKYWKSVRENTRSSMSGLHHGHYKAAVHSDKISRIVAQQITVVCRSGVPPEQWSVGLQVMLEKIAGICLVNKLRAIQLYEADFNWMNKFVF